MGLFSTDFRKYEINRYLHGGVRRKYALVLGLLAELTEVTFHGIGGVYYPSDVLRVLEVSGPVFPVVSPALDDDGIVLTSF